MTKLEESGGKLEENWRKMLIQEEMSLQEKLGILADAAKYDVSCSSSGSQRRGKAGMLGNTVSPGICHSFAADGRCISLLKILFTNQCIYDCRYCINRRSNDVVRTSFTPDEVCHLTMEFYRRNYIEGLFLSSGVLKSPDYTMDLLYQTLWKLRNEYRFNGYIHMKVIPGADPVLVEQIGLLADRVSINMELPTAEGLKKLAPGKTRERILSPMKQISGKIRQREIVPYRGQRTFAPAGQSTQMIVGATPESDYQMITIAEALYQRFDLKRVYYSAFVRVNEDSLLPVIPGGPPLLREHRLYQADWLLRYYGFQADELLSSDRPNFNTFVDPKCDWALRHLEYFPIEINQASYEQLLRVPGIGNKSAGRIVRARRQAALDFEDIKKMGVVLKRAVYFITCRGKMKYHTPIEEDFITRQLIGTNQKDNWKIEHPTTYRQLSLFDDFNLT